MQTLKYMILVFGGLSLLFWFADTRKVTGPSTGESCVAFVDRLEKAGVLPFERSRRMTQSERADFKLCADAVNSDREEDRYSGH